MEEAIAQAVREAAAQGLHGKAVTPFLLGRVGGSPREGAGPPTWRCSGTTPGWRRRWLGRWGSGNPGAE
jgi:hypothetical protein